MVGVTSRSHRSGSHRSGSDHQGQAPWRWWQPALVFLVVGAVIWLVVFVAAETLPRDYLYPRPAHPSGGPLAEMWMRWDAGWYREIVRHGYRYDPGVQSSVAFFPAYPLAIAAVAWAFPGVPAAGVAVTVLSGLGAAVLFHRWCSERMGAAGAMTSLLVLLLFPYAWYLFGAVYSDAFFLVAVLAAFLLVEREHYWMAGLVGFVVTASRPTGIAVAIGLVLVVLERANEKRPVAVHASGSEPGSRRAWPVRGAAALGRRFDPRALSWRTAPVLIGFGGLAAWVGYLWARFDDPLLFVHIEGTWWQGAGPRTWLKVAFFEQIGHVPHSVFAASLMLHAVAAIAAIAVVPFVARRFGWAYAGYVLIVMGIPLLGTKDFMSSGRYLLAAFPVFALIGGWLAERTSPVARAAWLGASAALLLTFSALWAAGKYLS
jgi:hypothetical protein